MVSPCLVWDITDHGFCWHSHKFVQHLELLMLSGSLLKCEAQHHLFGAQGYELGCAWKETLGIVPPWGRASHGPWISKESGSGKQDYLDDFLRSLLKPNVRPGAQSCATRDYSGSLSMEAFAWCQTSQCTGNWPECRFDEKMDPMSHQWGSTHRTISKSWKWETFQTSCKREHWKNIKNRVNFLKNIPGAKRDTAVLQSLIKEAIVFRVGRGWKWWKCLSSTTWVCRLTRDVLDSFTNLSRTGTAGDIGGAFTASIILFYSNHPEFNCDAHILLWGWSLNSQEAWDTEERRRVLNSWIRLN